MSVDHIGTITLAALGEIAHVGHVVRDLDAAMAEYTDQLGVSWAPVAEYGRGRRGSRFPRGAGGLRIELMDRAMQPGWNAWLDGGRLFG